MSTIGDTTAGPSHTVGGEGASGTRQAKEKAQQTAQQAAGQARGQIRRQVDERSTQAGEQVNSTASDVRSVAQQLREQGKEQPAKIAEQAADRAERLGSYLTQSDGERILRDVEDFGRKQPWAVVFGGLAAGFLASRFLKASSSRRAQTGYQPPMAQETTNGMTSPRPAENASLTGGVLPTEAPGGPRPGGAS